MWWWIVFGYIAFSSLFGGVMYQRMRFKKHDDESLGESNFWSLILGIILSPCALLFVCASVQTKMYLNGKKKKKDKALLFEKEREKILKELEAAGEI